MGLIAVRDSAADTEVLYDRATLGIYTPDLHNVEMRFSQCQLDAAKQVVHYVGRSQKIAGIKVIRGLSNMGLLEAKILWELAEKQI